MAGYSDVPRLASSSGIAVRDDARWLKSTFLINLGDTYNTFSEALSRQLDGVGDTLWTGEFLDPTEEPGGYLYSGKPALRDTSIGGNDAINCYPQYNEDDDIVYPVNRANMSDGGKDYVRTRLDGLGRVYKKAINDRQQIMYLSFGLPEYNTIFGFWNDVTDPDVARAMAKGGRGFVPELGRLVGIGVAGVVLLPFAPLIIINKFLNMISDIKITKYYDFRPEMSLYYRLTNGILMHLAVNMGLLGTTYTKSEVGSTGNTAGLPDFFKETGFDIFRIVHRKSEREVYSTNSDQSSDDALEAMYSADYAQEDDGVAQTRNDGEGDVKTFADKVGNSLGLFWNGFKDHMHQETMFVGFRIEKSGDATESLSNSTGESPVAQAINQKLSGVRSTKHAAMYGKIADIPGIGDVLGMVGSAVSGAVDTATSALGIGGAQHLIQTAGMVDIPEVWTGSDFSKNYSFTLALRNPYGDAISQYTNIYVPLALIMAGSFPRAIGKNSYTSPFLVRAYSRGLFAVPLGIIDSVTISRGSDQHGWTYDMYPTALDISFSIKDLSPTMYIALGKGDSIIGDAASAVSEMFGNTSSMQEYLLTLSGAGLSDRLNVYTRAMRVYDQFLANMFYTRLNPLSLGMGASDGTTITRAISRFMPPNLPGN